MGNVVNLLGVCSSTNKQSCAICLDIIIKKDRAKSDKCVCKYVYHKKCLEACRKINKLECPICRYRIFEHDGIPEIYDTDTSEITVIEYDD